MAFTRPTILEIITRIKSDIANTLSLPTILRRSFEEAMANATGGASHTLHGHINNSFVNFFPDTAKDEFALRWSVIFGVPLIEATLAELNVTITGTPASVLTVANGIYVRSDGNLYDLKDEITIPGGGSIAGVIVARDPGETGNMDPADTLNLQSPVAGIDSLITVIDVAIEGEEEEMVEDNQDRLLERLQNPPRGGSGPDYTAFAKEVAGVTRAWVLPGFLGQGSVGLTFVEDNEVPIIPSSAKVLEVQIFVDAKKPVTADLFTFAPITTDIDLEIALRPNTSAVRDAVTQEIEDLILRESNVKGALDPDNAGLFLTFDGKIALSKISEAISIAAGEDAHVLISPTIDPEAADDGRLLILGTITFSTLI